MGFCIDSRTRNVLQLAMGMMLTFIASMCHGFVGETVLENRSKTDPSISKHAGYYCASMLYASSLLSNVVAPPIVHFLGLRISLLLGGLSFAVYMCAFLWLNPIFLYAGAIQNGLISGIMWTAVGHYMALSSTEKTSARNSSMLWMIIMSGTFWGGIFMLCLFGQRNDRDITESTQHILYGSFTGVSIVGGIIMFLLPLPKLSEKAKQEEQKTSHTEELYRSFRLLYTFDWWLIAIPSAFTGIELSFWVGVYPTSLSFTKSFNINTNMLIALNCICVGAGELIGGFFFGGISKSTKVGRAPLVWLGSVVSIICYAMVWINIPSPASYEETYQTSAIHPSITLGLICGFLMGFCDCCINSLIYAFITVRYEGRTSQAFALSKFFHSALSAVCMFYGSVFSIPAQLSILIVGTIVSSSSFQLAERCYETFKRSSVTSSEATLVPSISENVDAICEKQQL